MLAFINSFKDGLCPILKKERENNNAKSIKNLARTQNHNEQENRQTALEGIAVVVNRGLVPPPSRVRPSMCTSVTPAVPYLLLGLQDVQWAVGNSRGARKLTRTPHVNQKKKKRQTKGNLVLNYFLFTSFLEKNRFSWTC